MSVKGYDNIYDISGPDDLAKPGDVQLQPVSDKSEERAVFPNPDMDEGPDRFMTQKLDYPWRDRDPGDEAQIPGISQFNGKPNQAPRSAFISDQTSTSPNSKDQIPNDETGTDDYLQSLDKDTQLAVPADPYVERIARSLVANYLLEHSPIELDLSARHKVSWSLNELVQATSDFSKKNEPRCTASFKLVRAKMNRYDIKVACTESYSDPAGHIVRLKFQPAGTRKPENTVIKVSCSCPFWRFYGSDWNSLQKDYNERQMSNGAAPTYRGRDHLICKHVASSLPMIKFLALRR